MELKTDRFLKLSYIEALPSMALYIECSTRIYSIYKGFIDFEDIYVYSIDEVFMDVTKYLIKFIDLQRVNLLQRLSRKY